VAGWPSNGSASGSQWLLFKPHLGLNQL